MAEFTFPCPLCKQRILCDASYVGSQINCPVCGQAIVVPPVKPAADNTPPVLPAVGASRVGTIQFKVSTLRTVALLGAGILAAVGIVVLTIHLFAAPKTLHFKAFVDGVEVVKLSGKKLWIEHLFDQLPAKISINGKKWNPVWDKNTSANYELNRAFKSGDADSVKLTKRTGRGTISIMEEPTPENNETLVIRVDDGGIGGADWYEFTVSW